MPNQTVVFISVLVVLYCMRNGFLRIKGDMVHFRCSYTTSNHKTKVSQNVSVIKCLCIKCLITKRLCHTTKTVIKGTVRRKLMYGDVYFYHDTHLHPAKFFFSPLYVSIYTYNEHVSKQYSYSLIIILLIV